MKILCILIVLFITQYASGTKYMKNKPLPYFRRQVEELFEDTPAEKAFSGDENNLVSLLIRNVKEIFNGQDDKDLVSELESSDDSLVSVKNQNNFKTGTEDQELFVYKTPKSNRTEDVMTYENITISSALPFLVIERKQDTTDPNILRYVTAIPSRTSKDTTHTEIPLLIEEQEHDANLKFKLVFNNSDAVTEDPTKKDIVKKDGRSCIFCNNVETNDCGAPKNNLIPSTVCEDHSFCYSQHTPFGIVDRGCYDVNRNETVYVCACNLCNHLSMGEMPMTYASKEKWIDDVVELSYAKRLKKSVYKGMSCLFCQVNSTEDESDMAKACLEGDITTLSSITCKEKELCGVKAVRAQGYLWRGCLSKPVYNYWLKVCDEDLCNYDAIVSLYDAF